MCKKAKKFVPLLLYPQFLTSTSFAIWSLYDSWNMKTGQIQIQLKYYLHFCNWVLYPHIHFFYFLRRRRDKKFLFPRNHFDSGGCQPTYSGGGGGGEVGQLTCGNPQQLTHHRGTGRPRYLEPTLYGEGETNHINLVGARVHQNDPSIYL